VEWRSQQNAEEIRHVYCIRSVHKLQLQLLSINGIEGASGDTILWCDGNLYFYFPPPYFHLFYIPLLTQLYSFTSSTI